MGGNLSDRAIASRALVPILCIAVFAALALLLVPRALIRTNRSSSSSLSAPLPPASAYPNLIDNGSLEAYYPVTRPHLWRFNPDVLFLWDEFSRGPGDHSLFIDASQIADLIALRDASSSAPHATLRYSLPSLRPGATYLLSLWLARDRNIDGVYPTAVLGGRTTRLSDFWASGRWQKITLVVTLPRLLPPDQRTLELRIPAGDYRLWIDDLVLRRIEARADIASEQAAPADSVAAPAGRPAASTALSRRLLRWTIPSTDRLLDIRIVFSRDRYGRTDARELWTNNVKEENLVADVIPSHRQTSAGESLLIAKTIHDPLQTTQRPKDEKKLDPSAAGVDTFAIPLDALHDLLTAIPAERQAASPALPSPAPQAGASQPRPHSPSPKPSARSGRWFARVEVFQYRTKLAESKPVSFKLSRQQADRPAAASQNEIAANAPAANTRAAHDALLDSFPIGIYGASLADFPALREAGFDAVYFSSGDAATLTRAISEASRLGLALLTSPPPAAQAALFPSAPAYFYLADEPEGRSVSPKLLYKSRTALRRLGLAQPGAIALCRSWRATDYASAVDVFMADPYPVPFEPLAWLSECLDEVNRAIAGDPAKRVWAVVQAFGWNVHPDIGRTGDGRAPTPAELRTLVRLALLHGADGLFFYTLQSGSYRLRDDKPLWQAVREAIAEARRLKPILDGPDSSPAPVLDCPDLDAYGLPAVHFVVKRSPAGTVGTPLVLALNTLDRPVRASLRLPGQATPLTLSLGPFEFVEIAREQRRRPVFRASNE